MYSKDLGSPRLRPSKNQALQPSSSRVSSSREDPSSSPQVADDVTSSENSDEASAVADSAAAANSNNAVCVRLCSLIKAQLVKAHAEVTRRYGGQQLPMTLSDAANSVSPGSNPAEETESTGPIVSSTAGNIYLAFPVSKLIRPKF